MEIREYQELAARTMRKELSKEETVLHALHGLSAEVGEIHSLYQKLYQGHVMKMGDLRKEIGDCLWMLGELCTAYGWNMADICRENIEKLKERYPEGFDPERSVHREEYE